MLGDKDSWIEFSREKSWKTTKFSLSPVEFSATFFGVLFPRCSACFGMLWTGFFLHVLIVGSVRLPFLVDLRQGNYGS